MALLTVRINGRDYEIACEDGQEEHVSRLAADLRQRVEALAAQIGQIGDTRLMLMAGLTVADELLETQRMLRATRDDLASRPPPGAVDIDVDTVISRVEAIARRLQTP